MECFSFHCWYGPALTTYELFTTSLKDLQADSRKTRPKVSKLSSPATKLTGQRRGNYIIHRNLYIHKEKNLVTTAFILYGVIFGTVILVNWLIPSNILETPLIGRYFAGAHLLIIVAIVAGIYLAMSYSKKHLAAPNKEYLLSVAEKKLFQKKYHKVFFKSKIVYIFVLMASTFLLPAIIYAVISVPWIRDALPKDSINPILVYIFAFIIFCVVFYFLLLIVGRKEVNIINSVVTFANRKFDDTSLIIKRGISAQIITGADLELEGIFRGLQCHLKHGFFAEEDCEEEDLNMVKYLAVKLPNKANDLSVRDRVLAWQEIKGKSLDDVFYKRFELEGAITTELPDQFKEILVNYQRDILLKVKSNTLFFDIGDAHIGSFYSAEGIILLLDDLVALSYAYCRK